MKLSNLGCWDGLGRIYIAVQEHLQWRSFQGLRRSGQHEVSARTAKRYYCWPSTSSYLQRDTGSLSCWFHTEICKVLRLVTCSKCLARWQIRRLKLNGMAEHFDKRFLLMEWNIVSSWTLFGRAFWSISLTKRLQYLTLTIILAW